MAETKITTAMKLESFIEKYADDAVLVEYCENDGNKDKYKTKHTHYGVDLFVFCLTPYASLIYINCNNRGRRKGNRGKR